MEKINAKVFIQVAQSRSFLKAGNELGYTQAGVNYIVSTMEAELGVKLFYREYGGVRLTQEGEALLPYFQNLVLSERQLLDKTNELRGLESGTVRVLVFDSISIHWIPGILREFKRDYPGVKIELVTVENSTQAEEMVFRHEVDCGFFLHSPISLDLDTIDLMTEKLQAIVSPEHPLAKKKKFPVKELGNHPFIRMAFSDNTGVSQIFESRKITPTVTYDMDNDYAAMAMVSQNLGYCIFPEILLRDAPYKVVRLDFDEPIKRTVRLGLRSMEEASPATKKFVECATSWIRREWGTGRSGRKKTASQG